MSESAHEGRSPEATYDVVVIGAGQAGLAIGYFLEQQGRKFVILRLPIRSDPPGATVGNL